MAKTEPTPTIKFTETTLCPKCGAEPLTVKYVEGTDADDEYLSLSCTRCTYQWQMKPLDSVPVPEE